MATRAAILAPAPTGAFARALAPAAPAPVSAPADTVTDRLDAGNVLYEKGQLGRAGPRVSLARDGARRDRGAVPRRRVEGWDTAGLKSQLGLR